MTFSTGSAMRDSDPDRTVTVAARTRLVRVLIAAVLAFASLVGWSFASPIGASPDDNYHQVSIWCAAGTRPGLCETTGNPDERSVLSVLADSSVCYAFVPEHSGKCDTPRTGMSTTGHGNFTGAYPPVYYAVMSIFTSSDVQTSILLIRLFNSLLAVLLVTSLYVLIDERLRVPMLWSLLLAGIPMGIFLVASVNPNGWAIMSAATMWVAMVGFFRAPTRIRQVALGVLALVSALMGAGSRGDSAAYVAFGAVIAAIIGFQRSRRYLISLFVPLVAVAMGAAFYLNSSQVGAALNGAMSGTPAHGFGIVASFIRTILNIPTMWVGNFGKQALGWGDVEMPSGVWFTTMALYIGLAFWALAGRRSLRLRIATCLAGAALVLVPSWIITQNGVEVGVLIQPRYILPLQILFIGVLLFGANGDPREVLTRVQRWVLVVGLSVANSISLYLTMRRYITGTDYHGIDLNKNIEWWWQDLPFPPDFFWALGSVGFAAVVLFASGILSRRESAASAMLPDTVTR